MDYFEEKPIGEKQELRVMSVPQWLSCKASRFPVGDAMYSSPCWCLYLILSCCRDFLLGVCK